MDVSIFYFRQSVSSISGIVSYSMKGLVEEGRRQAKGKVTDRTQWNKLKIKNESVIVERGLVVKGRIKLDEIKYTLAE